VSASCAFDTASKIAGSISVLTLGLFLAGQKKLNKRLIGNFIPNGEQHRFQTDENITCWCKYFSTILP